MKEECEHCGYLRGLHSPECPITLARRREEQADYQRGQDALDLNPKTNPHADPWD